MNNKLFKNKLNMSKDFMITAHGIVKAKESKTDGDDNGTRGGDGAAVVTGPKSPKGRPQTGTGTNSNKTTTRPQAQVRPLCPWQA